MSFSIDLSGLQEFAAKMQRFANESFKAELATLMQGIGADFLAIVQDVIIAEQIVDTRLLLASFGQGGPGNIWNESNGGLTIEVGSGVEYARWVNDGHHTTPAGVGERFVPGRWSGGRFVYDPGAKTGMLLKRKWVAGKHFWETAFRQAKPIVEKAADEAVARWLAQFF